MTQRGDDDEAFALPRKRDAHGFRTRRIHSPDLMRDIGERLESLGGARETPAARAYVEAIIASPYWGLRVLAIRAIAQWGGRVNKAWLMEKAARPTSPGWPRDPDLRWRDLETMTARAALRPLLKPEDATWFLDTWFDDGGRRCYAMGTGLGIVPLDMQTARLDTEMAAQDPQRRIAALLMASSRVDLPDRSMLIGRLLTDGDPGVSCLATALMRQFPKVDETGSADTMPTSTTSRKRMSSG